MKNKAHGKKMIAPTVVVILLLLYFIGFGWICLNLPLPIWLKVIGLLIPLGCVGVLLYVWKERLEEIRKGEEDDISKY